MLPGVADQVGKEVISVLFTSCTAAKSESRRVELSHSGKSVIDLVLTTRELARLIRQSGLELEQLVSEAADSPFNTSASAGYLCGVAGGEIEATTRTLYNLSTGNELGPAKLHRFRIQKPYREMSVEMGKSKFNIGTVSGLCNVVPLLEEIKAGKKKLHMLEVMACPEGCSNGGGQPYTSDEKVLRLRSKGIYDLDNQSNLHAAHLDPSILLLYESFLKEPGGAINKKIFYTTFEKREVLQ
jgi:iron only hydrogenase large subunit-like protein